MAKQQRLSLVVSEWVVNECIWAEKKYLDKKIGKQEAYIIVSAIADVIEEGLSCDFKGSGETEEELMNNLVDHAIKDNGYTHEDVMKPEMQEKIKPHIQKS